MRWQSNSKLYLEQGTNGFQVLRKAGVLVSSNLEMGFVCMSKLYIAIEKNMELLISYEIQLQVKIAYLAVIR